MVKRVNEKKYMGEKYDVVVGIPSYNEAKTIGHVAKVAGKGLSKYFPDAKKIIVNCDNNSPDDTKGAFLSAETTVPKKYISTAEGVKGKGNNFWNLFNFCMGVDARTIIVVDGDLRSIKPDWIKHLGCPIRDGFDFVTPVYSRHQFDGTITNHLCYPLVFSLTGFDVRQPIGGDFAFSRRLCSHWLKQPWNDMTRQYGIDIFMTLNALFNNFKVCQAGLGAKIHNASAAKLGQMFEEVVYTLFSTIAANRPKWLDTWLKPGKKTLWQTEPSEVKFFGSKKIVDPQSLEIDVMGLKKDCRAEYEKYHNLVRWYVSPFGYQKLNNMFLMDNYDVGIMFWSQVVYTLLYLFDKGTEEIRKEIINVLKPLYFARSITFDYKTWRCSISYAEEEIRSDAMAFLSQKPYLLGLYLMKGDIYSNHNKPA